MNERGRLSRLAGSIEAAHNAALVIERISFVWLARIGLLAVILANADKARWVAAHFSEAGAWSPFLLAYGVELVFAIGAYWLAHRLQTGEGRLSVLVSVVVLFALVSAVANVGYFEAHRPDGSTWGLVQAVALGLAAPAAAVAIAFLTGDLSALSQKAKAQAARLERREQAEAHKLAMRELDVALAREEHLTANAEARKAKAQSATDAPKPVAVPVGERAQAGWTFEQFAAYVQAEGIDVQAVTGDVVRELAGVSARTGRNWLARYRKGNGRG